VGSGVLIHLAASSPFRNLTIMPSIKTVAIIGAGPAGAIAVDALAQEQEFEIIRVFERREKAGGCWYDELSAPENSHLIYLGLVTLKTMFNNCQISMLLQIAPPIRPYQSPLSCLLSYPKTPNTDSMKPPSIQPLRPISTRSLCLSAKSHFPKNDPP
jgi:cation diffusion facilitator CzcD-associated flavoprotein CzcO